MDYKESVLAEDERFRTTIVRECGQCEPEDVAKILTRLSHEYRENLRLLYGKYRQTSPVPLGK